MSNNNFFPPNLPNNKTQAEQRLLSLKKRLVRDPELHQKYSAFMEDLLDKRYEEYLKIKKTNLVGICRTIPLSTLTSQVKLEWYLTVL